MSNLEKPLPTTEASQGADANNKTSANTTARQWQVLSQLQRTKWIGTVQILENLKLLGINVNIRTIQRDLNSLAKRFPLEKNNANPQGWRWKNNAPQESFPNMNLSQAVAFGMVQANLSQLLPPSILQELTPWFNLARKQLTDNKASQTWVDRVRIEPATQPLIAPDIDGKVKDCIYQSVFTKKRILASYKGRDKSTAQEYQLNPLAIIQRGVILYLLATKVEDQENVIRSFALHRFYKVEVLKENATTPVGFDLNKHLQSGAMGFNDPILSQLPSKGKNTKISLRLNAQAAKHLTESKLSQDQQVSYNEDKTMTINATVNLTSQLVWWLRGFGDDLKSIEPDILSQVVFNQAVENQ